MADKKQSKYQAKTQSQVHKEFIFERKNYIFMLIGVGIISLGFVLMAGGGSDDPTVFNPEIFNRRRIRLAPILIIIGFAVEIYAILLNPHKK